MRGASRSRVVLFSLSLASGAISLPACKHKKEVESAKASANRSFSPTARSPYPNLEPRSQSAATVTAVISVSIT